MDDEAGVFMSNRRCEIMSRTLAIRLHQPRVGRIMGHCVLYLLPTWKGASHGTSAIGKRPVP